MKKVLSSIGIGSASVDLVLPKSTVQQGERLDAELSVRGGSTEQEVEQVKYAVRTKYWNDDTKQTHTVSKGVLADGFVIRPDEDRTIDVRVEVPYDAPTTRPGSDSVWIDTALDIERALDPDDEDRIEVEPAPRLSAAFDAMDDLGFGLKSATNEKSGRSVVQEYEFRARSGPFAGELDELEVVPDHRGDRVDLRLEVDRSGGMLSEMSGTDESHTSVTVEEADPGTVREKLRRTIESFT